MNISGNRHVQFTKEIEGKGKIPFSKFPVTTTNYGQQLTERGHIDQSSCNPTLHKATTIKTLTRGVQLVCDSPDSLSDETRHLEHILQKKEKTITQTLSNSTLTETLNLTRQPTTQLLSQQ